MKFKNDKTIEVVSVHKPNCVKRLAKYLKLPPIEIEGWNTWTWGSFGHPKEESDPNADKTSAAIEVKFSFVELLQTIYLHCL